MPRPTITGPTIIVQVENSLLMWTDGYLSTDNPEYRKTANKLTDYQTPVNLTPFGPTIIANINQKNHPEQALAALLGIIPGRGRIIQAPESVLKLLPFPLETNQPPTIKE